MSKHIDVKAYIGDDVDMLREWDRATSELDSDLSDVEEAQTPIHGISQIGPLFEDGCDEPVDGVFRMVVYCNYSYPFDELDKCRTMAADFVTPSEQVAAELDCAIRAMGLAINRTNYRKFGQLLLEMYPEARKESSESDAYIKAAEMAIDAAHRCEDYEEEDWGNE